jgi:hypothetical protein
MAFTPTYLLKSNSAVTFRDQRHGARLFVDDQFRLAPKLGFQFHVAFSINPAALKSIDLVQRHKNEINMLVKSCSLPKFTIGTEVLNQYNRKKVVQNSYKFEPISISFHDDNMGVINKLWQNYFSYYYADSDSANVPGAYNRTATKKSTFIRTPYGFDNKSTTPFFNYITIYQMARHEYVSYRLINPLISMWDHSKLDYADSKTRENSASILFESVAYDHGSVTKVDAAGIITSSDEVEGFAIEHYDQTPSPLSGSADRISQSPSFTNAGNVTNNATSFLQNLTTTINTYQNTQQLTSAGTSGNSAFTNLNQTAGVSGVQGITFPQSNNNSTTTTATQRNL